MTRGQRPATSLDVARLAGVSRTTVSYVLNGTPNLSIKQETRDKVLAAARELNYQLQPAARALRKGQSDDIIFVGDRPLTLFMRDIIKVYQRRARELGYNLFVSFADDLTPEARHDFMLRIFSTRPAAIIASSDMVSHEEVELARSKGSGPLVSLDISRTSQGITLQAFEAAKMVTKHLLERGHQRLGLLAPQNSYLLIQVEMRLEAMREVLAGTGAPDVQVYPISSVSLDEGRRIAAQLHDDPDRPTAIFGFNDEHSFALMRGLHEQGLRVPDDIAVVGTDNLAFSEMISPSLTTINFDLNALGTRLIDYIDALLRGDDTTILLEPLPAPVLIPRESTDFYRDAPGKETS